MFLIFMVVILPLIISGASYVLSDGSKKYKKESAFIGWLVSVVPAVIFVGIFSVVSWTDQLDSLESRQTLRDKVTLYEERRDNLEGIIRAELSKYPEYEKSVIDNIEPQLLLNFPNLKTNEVLLETVKQVVKLNDDIYKFKLKVVDNEKDIRMYRRSIFTPHLFGPN